MEENKTSDPSISGPKPPQPDSATSSQQPHLQPSVGMVNGQPFVPAPISSGQPDAVNRKPSKWRYFFVVLGILQALGVALFLLLVTMASHEAKAGGSGTEFMVLLVFVTVVPVVAIIAAINLIGLPMYMKRHKPRGKNLVFSVISLVISLGLFSFGAYSAYQLYAVPKHLDEQSTLKSEQKQQAFAADNAKPEITKEDAIQLLQTCQLKGFYYTNQIEAEDHGSIKFPAAETSATGIVLFKTDGKPYRISIADKLIPELVPIARAAQNTCGGGAQFWHDGTYEQFKDGKWYFKSEVVNAMQTGETKEAATSLMQSCKVDYFVGYTDINLVKDESTKAWLQKAEQASTGIMVSENAPKTYVFASKAVTTTLQDTARQFRQSCYSTKKLYVTIDNTIETEYPIGTWTKVKQ